MIIEPNQTVAFYHPYTLNRVGVITLFSTEFNCIGINNWESLLDSNADVLVIISPELNFENRSYERMMLDLKEVNKEIIICNYERRIWLGINSKVSQLYCPSEDELRKKIRQALTPNKPKRAKFTKWVRRTLLLDQEKDNSEYHRSAESFSL